MNDAVAELLSHLHPVTEPEAVPPAPSASLWWWLLVVPAVLTAWLIMRHRRRALQMSLGDKVVGELRKFISGGVDNPAHLHDLVRGYQASQFAVPARTMSTPEIVNQLPAGVAARWRPWLQHLELLRFDGRHFDQPGRVATIAKMASSALDLIKADWEELAGPGAGPRWVK